MATKAPLNKYEEKIENEIEKYLNTLSFDQPENLLISPSIRRAKLKEELKEKANFPEFSNYIETAAKELFTEGKSYIDQQSYEKMESEFSNIEDELDKINLDAPIVEKLQQTLAISDTTINSIFKMAQKKYNEAKFLDSLSLFILLAMLDPGNPDYWYRAGILAQTCENYDLALRLYDTASHINPDLIGPWVYSSECSIANNSFSQAKDFFNEAIKKSEANIDDSWKEIIIELKNTINNF